MGSRPWTSWVSTRIAPLVTLSITVPILIVACVLEPDGTGVGTHRQLGLPACSILNSTGTPCITCGYTTSFSHAAHGHIAEAFITQPAGALLAMITAAVSLIAVYAMFTGISLTPLGRYVWRPRILWSAGGVVIVAWVYKILVIHGAFA